MRTRGARWGTLVARCIAAAALAAALLPARGVMAQATPQPIAPETDSAAPLDIVAAQQQLIAMINDLRSASGVAPLEPDEVLIELATERSQDMADRSYFSHEIPGVGFGPQWLLDQLPAARGTGENLGLSDAPDASVLDTLFNAWLTSPSHLENMLRPEFNRVGIGIVVMPGDGEATTIKVVTQVFAIAPEPLARA
jgi:uncharacterized protein YkwD